MSVTVAMPSSSTRQASTNALSTKRCVSSSCVELRLTVGARLAVVVEALAGLRAELARLDVRLHALVDVEGLATVGLLQVLGDVQHRVEAEQVGQEERPHRRDARGRHGVVDRLDREAVAPPGRARSR